MSQKKSVVAQSSVSANISTDLATRMIEKEHELYKSFKPSVVHELISIYSEAIEFYAGKNDSKYLDFQNRMHKMLMHPEVFQVLRLESSSSHKTPSSNSLSKPKSANSSEKSNKHSQSVVQEELATPLIIITDETHLIKDNEDASPVSTCASMPSNSPKGICDPSFPSSSSGSALHKGPFFTNSRNNKHCLTAPNRIMTQKSSGIILSRLASSTKDSTTRAINDMKSQDLALTRRLASRKKIQLTRSMNYSNYSAADISGISDYDANFGKEFFVIEEQPGEIDLYERMLEEIMEKSFKERAMRVAEIKKNYEAQIEEVRAMGGIMAQVVIQMEKNMQEDIKSVVEESDKKRKEDISRLKSSITV